MDVNLTPIGVVRNGIKEQRKKEDWQSSVSDIIITMSWMTL